MGRGIHRGFITHEELNKSLGKRNLSSENLSQAFIHILDENIVLVEKKSDYKVLRKKDASSKDEGKSLEKSDDPIRMYLREMGGVELLSREGEKHSSNHKEPVKSTGFLLFLLFVLRRLNLKASFVVG